MLENQQVLSLEMFPGKARRKNLTNTNCKVLIRTSCERSGTKLRRKEENNLWFL